MSIYELACKYYPRLWDKQRLKALVAAGRLTSQEVQEIIQDKEAKTDAGLQ